MARGKGRLGGIAAVVAALLVLVLGLACSRTLDGADAAPSATVSAASPNFGKQMLLRLRDLPLGYLLVDPGALGPIPPLECARITPRKPMPRLASFLKRYSPRGCAVTYVRLFSVPGTGPTPLFAGSAAADLGSVEAAEAGLAVSRELLTYLTNGELPEEVEPPEIVGEATRAFHWPGNDIPEPEEPISMVVWRWGDSVGLVAVMGNTTASSDRAALELARLQQKHLEAPTPYTPAERDDSEVGLEDPALQVPVYWLGKTFAPGHRLASLQLIGSSSIPRGDIDDPSASLLYTRRPRAGKSEAVEIELRTPQEWKTLRAKERPFGQHCAKAHELDLPAGRAVIYAGQHPGWRCRERGPKVYTAVIRFPGVVVTAKTMTICERCFGIAGGPYNSFKGMATIARALALRQPVAQAADAAPKRGANPTWQALRLSDLPLGYLKFNLQEGQPERIYCSRLTHPEDTPPKMGRFVDRFKPRGCLTAYYRLYTPPGEEPGPGFAAGGVLPLRSDAAADAGWAVVPEMLGRISTPLREVKEKERIGRASRLFHAPVSGFLKRIGDRATFFVWRSGNTLGATFAIGRSFRQLDRQAAALARLEDAHIRKPTRYTLAERFDGEVPLDDPKVDIPVYWLGRNFQPGGDLPDNRLFDSGFSGKATPEEHYEFVGAEAPSPPLGIRYRNIRLDTWTPATWGVFAKSKTRKAITAWKCTETRVVPLAEGTATIFGGYKQDYKRCPKKPPRAFTAWVDVGGVKVVVNAPPAPEFIETGNPYGSFAGMEAIVRRLTLRPPRFP